MKNIQVIDGADNCAYDIFSVSDDEFNIIFPEIDQDVEFIDDLVDRVGESNAQNILGKMWSNIVDKKQVEGIHGTLFYELDIKKQYYPNKRESDLDDVGVI